MIATTLIAILSEILVASIEPMAKTLGMTQIFVGVILVALVGNAAEHSTAVLVALKNKMDLAFGIAVGSSLQIALLVRCPGLHELSIRRPIGFDLYAVRGRRDHNVCPDRRFCGHGRRITLDGRCDAGGRGLLFSRRLRFSFYQASRQSKF